MHVDLWSPSTDLSNNSVERHLLNNMGDLTQFIVSAVTTETHAEHLTKTFMENFVLLFSIVVILVVDADIQLNSVFKDMCAALGIIYWPLAHRN